MSNMSKCATGSVLKKRQVSKTMACMHVVFFLALLVRVFFIVSCLLLGGAVSCRTGRRVRCSEKIQVPCNSTAQQCICLHVVRDPNIDLKNAELGGE